MKNSFIVIGVRPDAVSTVMEAQTGASIERTGETITADGKGKEELSKLVVSGETQAVCSAVATLTEQFGKDVLWKSDLMTKPEA
ncbi:MAG: hypothetical protein PHZ00_07125 [Candidatus Peribacteraceae bacterium]|nr:hypothetical protein [Candidatus Peribacteraceae bacterium]